MSGPRRAVVVGAGMGGLSAALRLARGGLDVRVLEARSGPGGLASGCVYEGFAFDAGPYVLLDRNGLEWAFARLGLDLSSSLDLRRLDDVYEVAAPDAPPVRIRASRDETAEGFERTWPGSARRYLRFVSEVERVYDRLTPLLLTSRPGPLDLLRTGAWRDAPFLLRGLASILARSGLPGPVQDALGIWMHVAGQRLAEAPSPLAFVPALVHSVGAFYPAGGIAAVPRALAAAAGAAGVRFTFGARVRRIDVAGGRARGVTLDTDEHVPADVVVSDASGIGTCLDLAPVPEPARAKLRALPLQSPGACAYLAVQGSGAPPYLRFLLPGGGALCQLLVTPAVPCPELERDGWAPARLIAPMHHADAERDGLEGQKAFLDQLLAGGWWRAHVGAHRVLATRVPAEWGRAFHLHRDSMNPVMTARFMRQGRLPHRSPYVDGLYLAGSATHPGQWVSFCAISGVLAAERALGDA